MKGKMGKKDNNLLNTIILAFILLMGIGLFYYMAGFFDIRDKVDSLDYQKDERDQDLKIDKCLERIYDLESERDRIIAILRKIAENEKIQSNINELIQNNINQLKK